LLKVEEKHCLTSKFNNSFITGKTLKVWTTWYKKLITGFSIFVLYIWGEFLNTFLLTEFWSLLATSTVMCAQKAVGLRPEHSALRNLAWWQYRINDTQRYNTKQNHWVIESVVTLSVAFLLLCRLSLCRVLLCSV
jgi:hypothetical protein